MHGGDRIPGLLPLDADSPNPQGVPVKNVFRLTHVPRWRGRQAESAPWSTVPVAAAHAGSHVRKGKPVTILHITFSAAGKLINIFKVNEQGNLFFF